MDKSQELREVLLRYLDADLERIIFSNPRTRESYLKLTVRPLLLRGALAFQTEEFTEKQAFQKNQNAEKTAEYLLGELENRYRNAEIASLHGIVNILISKKGTVTIKEKKAGVKRAENRTVSVAAGDVQKAGKQMPAKSHADVKENSLENRVRVSQVTKTERCREVLKYREMVNCRAMRNSRKMPEQDCRLAWMPQRFQNVWLRYPITVLKNTSFRKASQSHFW